MIFILVLVRPQAIITIEIDNVILDLNGFTVQQSKAFYFQQCGDTWINAKSLYIKDDGIPYGASMYGLFLNGFGASTQGYHWSSDRFS